MIPAMLQRLKRHGEFLEITWSQDDDMWAVDWTHKGRQYAAKSIKLETALSQVWIAAAVDNSQGNKRVSPTPDPSEETQ